MNLIIKPWTLGKCLISKASLTRTSSRTSIKSSNESPKLNFPKTCYGSEYSLPPERQHFKDSEEEESGVNISLTFNSLVPLFSHEIRDSSNEKLGNADHPLQEFNFPSPFYRTNPILGEQHLRHLGRNTLVLDLDETLVHSSLNALNHYSFVLPVKTLELQPIFVAKRPGVELFLKTLANLYEIVIFTASVSDYANPLIDILDPFHFCTWRLFREHCVIKNGRLVKDLSLLGRDLKNVIILDNSPESFALQPKNGIRVKTWLGDKHDTELFRLLPILEALAYVKDICHALTSLEKLGKQEVLG